MKKLKSALVAVSVLTLLIIWGFIGVYKAGYIPTGLDVFIFALIMISGIYAFVTHMKQHKEIQRGFPAEDEMSTRIKYKAGYHAFMASMYVWLFIFLFKDLFPDVESMLGGGILLSALISMVIKSYLTRNYNENQN